MRMALKPIILLVKLRHITIPNLNSGISIILFSNINVTVTYIHKKRWCLYYQFSQF